MDKAHCSKRGYRPMEIDLLYCMTATTKFFQQREHEVSDSGLFWTLQVLALRINDPRSYFNQSNLETSQTH